MKDETKSIKKILVANRGEIAQRVMRTARDMGIRTVAVYSEADIDAPHVVFADQAVCIGPAPVGQSYLNVQAILDAAQKTGADAVHPGYGFLSENADFAEACAEQGLTFIGPPVDAIRLMGSKRQSKIAMIEAGVPCVPGYEGASQDNATLIEEAAKIGFPVMIKASAGGGGRGMRVARSIDDMDALLNTARSEAENAFGSGELILEKAVLEPRHIEIQVFADTHGNTVYLGERDCSVQRRHQKVVEEAPSPFVDPELREKMGIAAVDAARSCHYVGAGTVEFLVDADKNFYFLEMNTRLQVEHPVTECITGTDLVQWQIQVAEGDVLPMTQDQIELHGHAIEVRLYAEDPRQHFLPQTGQVCIWSTPEREGIRIDGGIQSGQWVSPHYDPMLAKVIASGRNRSEAIRRLASYLQDMTLLGLNNNKLFLQNLLRHPAFGEGLATTAFIEQIFADDISLMQGAPSPKAVAKAVIALYMASSKDFVNGNANEPDLLSWSSSIPQSALYRIESEDQVFQVRLETSPFSKETSLLSKETSGFSVKVDDDSFEFQVAAEGQSCLYLIEEGVRSRFDYALGNGQIHIEDDTGHATLTDVTQCPADSAGSAGSGQIMAVMDGVIVDLMVSPGDSVTKGQPVVVLEAMKMEHLLKAQIDGTVVSVACSPGQQVKTKQVLAVLEPAE